MHFQKKLTAFLLVAFMAAIAFSCSENKEPKDSKKEDITVVRKKEKDELIQRGKYLVTVAGCNDCHSPKVMTPQGPMPDVAKLLSGYPGERKLPAIRAEQLKDRNWVAMSPDVTAFLGPWGISFAANLTPDSTTGIGSWTEEIFVKTVKTGKHLGQEGGRPILPPMPWYNVAKMSDEDLSAVYAYLRSLPAINNRVPGPVSPNELIVSK